MVAPRSRRRTLHRAQAWLPVVLWAGLILMMSGGDYSAAETGSLLRSWLHALFGEVSRATLATLHLLVRKGAHVFEYGVLSLLAFRALRHGSATPFLRAAGLSLALVAAVATADESHQARVPTRTGSPADVALDVAGGALALGLVATGLLIHRRRLESVGA